MKNSNAMSVPLCLPFACFEFDSRNVSAFRETRAHYFAEILFIREGNLHVRLDQEEMTLRPGEAAIICPGVSHQVSAGDSEEIRLVMLRMDPDRLPEFPDYSPNLKSILAEARRSNISMRLSAEETAAVHLSELSVICMQEFKDRPFGFDLSITARMAVIWMHLIRYWIARGLKLPEREAQTDPIYSLTGYIQSHLKDNLRVEDLAARCGLSYPWFAKKFREIYGVSCKDCIEQIRVARVEQFLLFTDMDLAEISKATGYADCSHMIKNFKRVMEITPGQYRLRNRR